MGIKPMQLPPTHTFRPCPNLPLVLHRQADSHAETLSLALWVLLSARCLSLPNQPKPDRTHRDDSGKGLIEARCSQKQQPRYTRPMC